MMDEGHYESIDSQSGEVDYYTYIQSDRWRQKANQAKQRAGYRCQICNRSASETQLHAHHRTYERLGHETPEDITVLCRDCHSLYEAHNNLRKGAIRSDERDEYSDSSLEGDDTDEFGHNVDPERYLLTRMGDALYVAGFVSSIVWLLAIDIMLMDGDWWLIVVPEFFIETGYIWMQSPLLWQLGSVALMGWGLAKGSAWLVDKIEPNGGALRWYWRWSPSALARVPFFLLVVVNLLFFPAPMFSYLVYAVSEQPTVLQFPLVLPAFSVYLALLPLPLVHLIWDNSHRSGWGKLAITVAVLASVLALSFAIAGLIFHFAQNLPQG